MLLRFSHAPGIWLGWQLRYCMHRLLAAVNCKEQWAWTVYLLPEAGSSSQLCAPLVLMHCPMPHTDASDASKLVSPACNSNSNSVSSLRYPVILRSLDHHQLWYTAALPGAASLPYPAAAISRSGFPTKDWLQVAHLSSFLPHSGRRVQANAASCLGCRQSVQARSSKLQASMRAC